jgi:hypothetical protein
MPASAAVDPAGLLRRPFPTSAWFANLLWGPGRGEHPVQVKPAAAACLLAQNTDINDMYEPFLSKHAFSCLCICSDKIFALQCTQND